MTTLPQPSNAQVTPDQPSHEERTHSNVNLAQLADIDKQLEAFVQLASTILPILSMFLPQLRMLIPILPVLTGLLNMGDDIARAGNDPAKIADALAGHLKDVAQQVQALKLPGRSEPGDPARENFPAALRFKVGPLTGQPEEPIAADARRESDGKHLAPQKVIAGPLGVPVDDVRKREAIADSRRVKIAAAGVLVLAVLALFAGYLFVEHRRQLALEQARFVAEETQFQVQQRTNVDTKRPVEKLLATSQVQSAPGAERAQGAAAGDARWQRALALLHAGNAKEAEPLFRAFADDKVARISQDKKDAVAAYRNVGAIAGLADPKRAREAYAQAVALDPDDREALYWNGWLQLLAGNLGLADRNLIRLQEISTADQDDRGIYHAYLRLGEVLTQRGNLRGARDYEDHAYDIAKRNAERSPDDLEWRHDLSESYGNVGDVQLAQGDLAGALKSYGDGLAIIDRLSKSDPGNAGWQRDLSLSSNRIGRVQVAQGDLAGALKSYDDGLAIIDRLSKSDPGNASWQRDLSVSNANIGDVQVAQGDLAGALKSYGETLAIADRLAKSDPGNAGWQSDLSASYANVGDVQVAQGDLAGTLQSYRDSHAIRERLAKSDPGNAGWQRDLSLSSNRIGNVQVAQGDLAGALKSYRDSHAIREHLVKSDPGNTGWQHDLSASYSNLAEVFKKQGEKAKALNALRQGRAIVVRMTSLSPDNAVWKRDLAWFDGQIAELANRRGQATGR